MMSSWLAAVLLLLLALGVVAWLRRHSLLRAWRDWRGVRVPRYPVLFLHGVVGFDVVDVAGQGQHHYYRGVVHRLRELGVDVHLLRVPSGAPIAARAGLIADKVRAIGTPRVNLIAHSMGGLDARYAISTLGLGRKVASLTTVGTPHRGTPLADVGTTLLGDRLGLRHLARLVRLDVRGFYQLTTQRCAEFNDANVDNSGVWYASVVGASAACHAALRPSAMLLERHGPHDGLVPATSQRWGEVIAEIDADHIAQVGWSATFDAVGFYESLARELALRGF